MHKSALSAVVFFAAVIALTGCSSQSSSPGSQLVTGQSEFSEFPYDPLVYHLDLSILAYQLYGQTLVWPFDPYYEETQGGTDSRGDMMEKVRLWADRKGQEQLREKPLLGGYRGPGRLAGFADNNAHDPIIYRYDRINPWKNTMTNTGGRWVEYMTPKAVTGNIGSVRMCYRKTGRPEGEVALKTVASDPSGGRDILFAFEGGTGDKSEVGQPASHSLMGFILLRRTGKDQRFDIHIAFRGSRSGSLVRSVRQGLSTNKARGNADWITDLGYRLVDSGGGAGHVTTVGKVHRGFARSIQSILPQLFRCLERAGALAPNGRPTNIYVTGHSLGGGLAQHFVSAVLLGNQYGPNGTGAAMPDNLRQWPWRQIKLITYGAPRAGNSTWAKTLTTTGLASEYYGSDILPLDPNALESNDPSISARLANAAMPAAYRVLVSNDAVTTSALPGREPVGKSVYVDKSGALPPIRPYRSEAHDPSIIREKMLSKLDGAQIAPVAWRYQEFVEVTGGQQRESQSGIYAALQTKLLEYELKNATGFDRNAYQQDVELFNGLINDPQ